LHQLSDEAMMQILTEPRNAIIKQYQKLLSLEEVELVFEEDALLAVVRKAKSQKTGARGLRSIIEMAMLDIMFTLPSMGNVEKCIITRATIEDKAPPMYQKRKASA
jgi:ATP-dependent Clp protease ATP-binding subunit ClpX